MSEGNTIASEPAAVPEALASVEAAPPPEAPEPAPEAPPLSPFEISVNGLPPDLRNHPSMSDFKDFEGLAKSYVNQQSLLGKERIAKPSDDWSDEQWTEFFGTVGRPATVEGYTFKEHLNEETFENASVLLDPMTEAFHAAGLSDKQASKVAEAYLGTVNAQQEQMATAAAEGVEAAQAQLKQEWGSAYEAKLEAANEAASSLFGGQLTDFQSIRLSDGTFLGDNPLMVRLLAALGESVSEGSVHSGGGFATLTPEDAASELKTLEGDANFREAWLDRDHPQHEEALKRRLQLRAMMDPGNATNPISFDAPKL